MVMMSHDSHIWNVWVFEPTATLEKIINKEAKAWAMKYLMEASEEFGFSL
jgi:hypothetical protein